MFAIHAPAKVNLYLHVGPPNADGRHPLDSLVVFADANASDRIAFEPGGNKLEFDVAGLTNAGSVGPEDQNLVVRALRQIEKETGAVVRGRLTLEKHLPIAAGIGGGSADAAATLHLLNRALELELSLETLIDLARPLGGDIPACVAGQPVLMRGDGDRIEPYPGVLPDLHGVLVTPDIACPTGPVFRRFDEMTGGDVFEEVAPPVSNDLSAFCRKLRDGYRNDLTSPARSLHAVIGELLQTLSESEASLFSAMSGSGATCFSLFADADNAQAEVSRLKRLFPAFWVRCSRLGKAGFDPDGFTL